MCSNFIMAGVHFIILKINGVDVNHLPHDEAVRMFLNASDPIHIEVCRKRDSHCKQYDNNDGGNIANNSRRDSETAVTATPTFDQKNKQRFTAIDDGQLLTGLVLCQTAGEPTIATTPTTNRKRVNSASSAAHNNRSSPQKQHSATSATAKSLTLYFPPPPPVQLPTTLDQQRASDVVEQVESSGDTTAKTYIIRRSSLSNATKNDDISKLGNNSSSSTACARLQPPPPAPSLHKAGGVDESVSNAESSSSNDATNPKLISTAIQTDVNDFVHSLFRVSNTATTEQIIEQEHNLFEACLAPEIDIEEITLRKSDSNEHLGLAVCYSLSGSSSGNNNSNVTANGVAYGAEENETCTEVYISDIQPDSIAGRDGRLRQGDQILQVNGKDVTNKKETETLIAENNNAVTLLVSRYLYADEDDFNDTCVAGIDVEDEDEDDDDDEAYYNENNLAYENCFITPNEHCSTDVEAQLNTALLESTATPTITHTAIPPSTTITTTTTAIAAIVTQAATTKPDDSPCKTAAITTTLSTSLPTKPSTISSQKIKTSNRSHLLLKYDPLNHLSIKAHLNKVNQELAMLDSRVENMMMKPGPVTNAVDYDTEHIYETIPEDSESEPFYCSPYESSTGYVGPLVAASHNASVDPTHLQQQKQRVAAWLGMQPTQRQHAVGVNGRSNTLLHYPHGITTMEMSTGGTIVTSSSRSKSGTVRSAATTATTGTTGSTSSGGCGNLCQNEHENSSSAYNTGGSNNSGTALTLVLNSPHARNVLEQSEVEQMAALRISKSQRLLSPKEKLTSPKHQSVVTTSAVANRTGSSGVNCADFQIPSPPIRTTQQVASVSGGSNTQQQFSTSTMYTNVANLQQTMQLQQQLFRQALTQQQQQHQQSHFFNLQQQKQQQQPLQQVPITPQQQSLHMHTCPQFTAPNLSQYHFVSSQEVSVEQIRAAAAAAAAKASNEEPMVWKVKRRQDGTRYIVRRPARTRMMRDRALRINAERENQELTTTEDDTISEIKTGRYWTREERKKHIERARERRQQQQQQLATAATMRISDKAVVTPTVIKCQVHPNKEKSQASSSNAQQQQTPTVNSKLQRQSSTKLQHHQLQFGSAATAQQADTLKQKQVPLSMTVVPAGATLVTNVANTAATNTGSDAIAVETASTASCNNTSANTIPATTSNTNATVVTGTATAQSAPAAGTQTQPTIILQAAPNNGNKMAGLLSVTTV